MKSMLLLVNTHTSKSDLRAKMVDIIDIFVRGGYEVTVQTSQQSLDVTAIIREKGSRFDVVTVCGGDGTVNEAVNGLMSLDSPPALGYIPTGTTNDFAISLGIPTDVADAAASLVNGREMLLDIGYFNQSRHFGYVAAFGAFSDIPYSTPQNQKNRLGRAAYVLEGVKSLPRIRPVRARFAHKGVEYDEEVILGLVSNSSIVAGFQIMDLSDASLQDGLLEVTLVRNPKTFSDSGELVTTMLTGGIDSAQNAILSLQVGSISFDFDSAIPWTLDGEYGGSAQHVEISIVKKALRIIVNK
ncbi:MAG: diacylglycerol kinase family lipid kinase [Eubacteriaceae bacterium]|nr:diacylglycerol kinase family lipid kinase [Eubacteriaceae bacterium]